MAALVLFLPSSLLQVFQRRSFSWYSNLLLLYIMRVLEPVSLLVCVRCDNGVNVVFAVVVLLVLVGKVG